MVQSLRVRGTQARMIMRPRDQVVALWLDRPPADNLRIAQTSGHSRFPVCEGSLDNLKGGLLVREWLWQIQVLGGDAPARIAQIQKAFETMDRNWTGTKAMLDGRYRQAELKLYASNIFIPPRNAAEATKAWPLAAVAAAALPAAPFAL